MIPVMTGYLEGFQVMWCSNLDEMNTSRVNSVIILYGIEKALYICTHLFGSLALRCTGGMAEWSNAAVLKTVEGHTSGGSNPSSSAMKSPQKCGFFYFREQTKLV